LFLIGFSLIYALNITRITTILIIGYQYGEETALQLFHLLGGWILIFIGTLLLLLFSEKVLHAQIFVKSRQKCTQCNSMPENDQNFCLACGKILQSALVKFHKADVAKMTGVIACVMLLVSIQTPVFALTEGPAQIVFETPVGEQGNTQLLPQIQGYTLEYMYRDKDFEEISGQDASLVYAYMPADKTKEPIWVTVEIGSATAMLHGWEACLISWPIQLGRPVEVTQLDLKDVQILQNPPIIARYFAFQWTKTNQTQVALYWYESSIFMTNSTAQQKRVKTSLITYPNTTQNLTKMEELLPFAATIAQYWAPIKTWSSVALLLSKQSIYLAATTIALLFFVAILYAVESRKQRKANIQAYQKLSTPTKQFIDIVGETEKKTTPTFHAIATAYKSKTNEPIEQEKILQKLSEAEKAGMIKSEIANVQDIPTHVWKSQVKIFKENRRKK
jgi:hypothetical protein